MTRALCLPLLLPILAAIAFGLSACGLLPPGAGSIPVAHRISPDLSSCQRIPAEGVAPSVPKPSGPEDVAIDHGTGMAYISATDRRAVVNGHPVENRDGRPGRLLALDLTVPEPVLLDVTPEVFRDPEFEFQPHGISLYPYGRAKRLFVINHQPVKIVERQPDGRHAKTRWDTCETRNSVEILELAPGRLRRAAGSPVAGDLLISPNDIAAVGERSFYVTNDHGAGSCFAKDVRDVFDMNRDGVVYFDGRELHRINHAVPYANGVVAEPRSRRLYVSSTGTGKIHRFSWANGDPARLTEDGPAIRLGTGADNLDLAPDGSQFVAAHPRLLQFVAYAFELLRVKTAPSQIIRIHAPGSGTPTAEEVLYDEGKNVSGASVAAVYHWRDTGKHRVLIGSVFEHHLMLCDVPDAVYDNFTAQMPG